jgi:hypothetical protein
MPIQFRPVGERTRRSLGRTLIGIAVALVCGLAGLPFLPGDLAPAAFMMVVISAGLFPAGYWLLFKGGELFEIDPQQRTYSLIRSGSPPASGPLDELGPLHVTRRTREVRSRDERRTSVEYVVQATTRDSVALYVESTAGKARRKMEALAKVWRLSCRSLGGAVRGPDELDLPLHERLRDDGPARTMAELRPEWGVRIEALPLGYAIRSTHRTWRPLVRNGGMAVLGGLLLWQFAATGFLTSALHDEDPRGRILAGLFCVVVVVLLWPILASVRDAFFPSAVLVTDRGVSYRLSRMPFRDIEEVMSDFPIEVVGDRRSLLLGTTFCPAAAVEAVAHELQRLIIEVAETNPHARAAS